MTGLSGMNADTRNKAIVIAVFVLVAAGIVYYDLFAGGTPNPAATAPPVAIPALSTTAPSSSSPEAAATGTTQPASSANTARRVSGSSAALDPALHMQAMLAAEQVEYSGVGRNIFSPNSAPPITIPKPIAPARPVAAMPPAQPIRTGPPPPPPIELTFFGTETDAAGKRLAILLHQDTVYTAQAGDVVLRRYRILSIDARSLQVEDMLTNNKQTLPLVAN
jgi:hypothetical protein